VLIEKEQQKEEGERKCSRFAKLERKKLVIVEWEGGG